MSHKNNTTSFPAAPGEGLDGKFQVRKQVVDKNSARKLLDETVYERQRSLRIATAKRYAKQMKMGDWSAGTPLHIAVLGKKQYLVDGQHRLKAVELSETEQAFGVVTHVLESESDLDNLYFRLDSNMGRNDKDMIRSTNMSLETGLPNPQLDSLAPAVRFLMRGFSDSGPIASKDEVRRKMVESSEAAALYFEAISSAAKEIKVALVRRCVLSVGVATFEFSTNAYGDQKVMDFWEGVASDNGLKVGDPRKLVFMHLLTTKLNVTGDKTKNKVSANYQARYIANAWNAWVKDEERSLIRVKNTNESINLSGTPWETK